MTCSIEGENFRNSRRNEHEMPARRATCCLGRSARSLRFAATLAFSLFISSTVVADGPITDRDLLEPDWQNWLTYSGDYSGQRHSALNQIHPGNVHKLAACWIFPVPGANRLVGTPIVA